MPNARTSSSRPTTASSSFTSAVLSVVSRIPPGRIATYGDVARLAGRPRAARAVGTIMRTTTRPGVPCHRVVGANGRLSGYGGRAPLKAALLAAEGLRLRGARIVNFRERRWSGRR